MAEIGEPITIKPGDIKPSNKFLPDELIKNVYLSESIVAALGGAEEVESHLDNGWHLVVVPDHVPKEGEG